MTGMSMPRSRIAFSTPMPSRPGMTRSRMTTDTSRALGPSSDVEAGRAALGDDARHGRISSTARLEQPALDRIVIDYEDGTCHDCLSLPARAIRRVDHLGTGF